MVAAINQQARSGASFADGFFPPARLGVALFSPGSVFSEFQVSRH
jgi:hypothetical protein